MYLIIDSIEWEDIKNALIFELPLPQRRRIALDIEPFPLIKMCADCNKGNLQNEQLMWGIFKDNKLCHILFDEETADKYIDVFGASYNKKLVRVGWK